MSQEQSAFNFVGSSNGQAGVSQLRRSKVSIDDSLSSSIQSSIPELSRAEELAIKRESATFAPIGQKPSDDLMRDLDRASGLRRTSEWDGDGIEVTQQSLSPPVEVIPSHVRGSTPDRVASSGIFMLKTSHGEQKKFDAVHLQDNADTSSKTHFFNLAKSTRGLVTALDDEQPSTSRADPFSLVRRRNSSQTDGYPSFDLRFQVEPEKKRPFLPRCLLLLICLMIALAAVVAFVVVFKEEHPNHRRGKVVPNDIVHYECENKQFNLGDILNFTCTFDAEHAYRINIVKAVTVELIPINRVSSWRHKTFTMNVTSGYGTSKHEITVESDEVARCSSVGTYYVEFRDINNTAVADPRPNITITIRASKVTATMTQRQLAGDRCLETEFDLTCDIRHDCNSYDATIFKNKAGRITNFNSYLKCERNYTDDDGYMMACSASLPDKFIENYSFLACKMETKLPNNQVLKREQRYKLPSCGVESRCHTREPGYSVFNCSEKADDYQNLQEAVCHFSKQTNCLKDGRQVFSMEKNNLDKLTCSGDNLVRVCRLSWCSDYSFIKKNEIPGVVICSPSFNERYVSPTTTTTTEAPSGT